ncbi:MAG: hypothetical protein WC289_02705 [Patescibacteria group bacterium]|jgi:hypothetical protein
MSYIEKLQSYLKSKSELVGLFEKLLQYTVGDLILTGMIFENQKEGRKIYAMNFLTQRSIIICNVELQRVDIQIFFLSDLKNYKVTEEASSLKFEIIFGGMAKVFGTVNESSNVWVKEYFKFLPILLTKLKERFELPPVEDSSSLPIGFVDGVQETGVNK